MFKIFRAETETVLITYFILYSKEHFYGVNLASEFLSGLFGNKLFIRIIVWERKVYENLHE